MIKIEVQKWSIEVDNDLEFSMVVTQIILKPPAKKPGKNDLMKMYTYLRDVYLKNKAGIVFFSLSISS